MLALLAQLRDKASPNMKYLNIVAHVRHTEDATINGVSDKAGAMPGLYDELWDITVELATGKVLDWPQDITARIHYKVCDSGDYFILDENMWRVAERCDNYVPRFLAIDSEGWGDYIILTIEGGAIRNWKWSLSLEELCEEGWERV